MRRLLKVWAAAIVLLASATVQALPPEPGSQVDGAELEKLAFGIAWSPTVDYAQKESAKVRADREKLIVKSMQMLQTGCNRNDAYACAQIATTSLYFTRFPDPRAARLAHATKAADLYIQFCEAKPDERRPCKRYDEFLDDVIEVDEGRPEVAIGGLPAQRLRLARAYVRACELPDFMETNANLTEAQFDAALDARSQSGRGYAGENCDRGIALLTDLAPSEALALQTARCNRDKAAACRAIGKLTASEQAGDKGLSASCDAGDAEACLAITRTWMNRRYVAEYTTQTRNWARKACNLNSAMGCMVFGHATTHPDFGTPDYPAAADALGKACKSLPEKQGVQACNAEKSIRNALAAAQAKAGS